MGCPVEPVGALFGLALLYAMQPGCTGRDRPKSPTPAEAEISVARESRANVQVTYTLPDCDYQSVTLYRSYLDLSRMASIDVYKNPISVFGLPTDRFEGVFVDTILAEGTGYSYYLCALPSDGGRPYKCNVDHAAAAPAGVTVAEPRDCYLLVDKSHYVLELLAGNRRLKSYPICLGENPVRRKTFMDRLSTPEGEYRVAYVNLNSKYHKALMLDYPNGDDRARYARALSLGRVPVRDGIPVGIGGDIAIHGGGLGNNWTWGCIAMENDHIDELLGFDCVRAGTRVAIVGSEVSRGRAR